MRNGRLNHNELWVINYLIFLQRGWMVRRCGRTCHSGLFKYCSEEIKFTHAVSPTSSISSMTLTYIWSKGVHACSIHVTGMISFTLVNIWETVNTFCTLFLSPNDFFITWIISNSKKKLSLFSSLTNYIFETCDLDIIFSSTMFFFLHLLTWWLWNKPDLDHGNSVHKHVWVMLLKKTNLITSRTI